MTQATEVTLGTVADVEVGFAFKSTDFDRQGKGPRLLRGDNIAQGFLRWNNAVHLAESKAFHSRYKLLQGDIVIAMDRPWIDAGLKFATVHSDDLPAFLVQRVARLRTRAGNDQRYLSYVVRSGKFTEYILAMQTGTAIPHISSNQICKFRFPPHSLREQRAIAEVLGALDDKIAANARLVAAADGLARTLFGAMGNNADSRPLTDVATFVNGKAFTKDATGTGRVVIRIAELNSGLGGSTVYNDIVVGEAHLARPGDLLFAWSGSLTLHRWFRSEGIINQHIFKVIPRAGYPLWLVNQLLVAKLDEFKGIAADKATTMGHIQRRHLDEPVEVPDQPTVENHNSLMSALWSMALSAEQENESLAAIRDILLPALMSGKLRVRDAKKQVEEVL